jgi:hypothetical protein
LVSVTTARKRWNSPAAQLGSQSLTTAVAVPDAASVPYDCHLILASRLLPSAQATTMRVGL